MSLLSYSLTVSVPDSQERIASVRCTTHTATGVIISGTRVTLPDTLSEQVNSIGCAVVEMLSTLLPTVTRLTEGMEGEGDDRE